MNIIFAGTPEFAASALSQLLETEHEVIAVYTQPDRPAGRGRQLTSSPVKQLALQRQIPVCQPSSLRDASAQQALTQWQADVMIVAAYGLLLPQAVLDAPSYGCVNIHASLLPRWRGAAPIQHAILAGDTETGVSIMQMDAGLDTGAVLLERAITIEDTDTAATLHDKLAALGGELIVEYLEKADQLTPTPQDEAQATYAHKLQKQDAAMDWQQPAAQLARAVRAYNPWPICYSQLGDTRIRIWSAKALNEDSNMLPGTIWQTSTDGIDVSCSSGSLRITELQLPGGKVIKSSAALQGVLQHCQNQRFSKP